MAKLPCTDPRNGVSALKLTCQTSDLRVFSAFLYSYLSVFLSQKKECNFFKTRHDDDRCSECQERNYMESSWYLRLYV